jgi:hypothetical protein
MSFVDYDLQCQDMKALIIAHTTGFKVIEVDMEPEEVHTTNLPACDITFQGVLPEVKTGNDYYVATVLQLEIAALDMSSKRAASTIVRDQLTKVHTALRDNPRYGDSWDAVILGEVVAATFPGGETGGWMASVVVKVTIFRYADR